MSGTPLVVAYDDPPLEWHIDLGDFKHLETGKSTRAAALHDARQLARDRELPGIVIHQKNGSFDSFWSNDEYWSRRKWKE